MTIQLGRYAALLLATTTCCNGGDDATAANVDSHEDNMLGSEDDPRVPKPPSTLGDFFPGHDVKTPATRNIYLGAGSSRRPSTEVKQLVGAGTDPTFPPDMVFRSYGCPYKRYGTYGTCVDILFFDMDKENMTAGVERVTTYVHGGMEYDGKPKTNFDFYFPAGTAHKTLRSWLQTGSNVAGNLCAFLPNVSDGTGLSIPSRRSEVPGKPTYFSAVTESSNHSVLTCLPDDPIQIDAKLSSEGKEGLYRTRLEEQNKASLRSTLAALEFDAYSPCAHNQVSFVNVGKRDLSVRQPGPEPSEQSEQHDLKSGETLSLDVTTPQYPSLQRPLKPWGSNTIQFEFRSLSASPETPSAWWQSIISPLQNPKKETDVPASNPVLGNVYVHFYFLPL